MTQRKKTDTGKWIRECRNLYEKTVQQASKRQPDPGRLERALAGARTKRRVGPEELEIIEKGDYWPYPQWWPKLSEQFGKPIRLPERVDSRAGRNKAVSRLQERLKHIEVVSIILRFLFPREFGIISPPVIGLLNLVPVPDKDHTWQYLRYLDVLGELRRLYHYQFKRIADFDMALWTAAQLQWREQQHEAILKMHRDDAFQEIRLRNLLECLGENWSRTLRERLLLAKELLDYDPIMGAVMVARCYEKIIREVGNRVGCEIRFGNQQMPVSKQLKHLAEFDDVRRKGVSPGDLDLWQFRNDAVHGEKNPVTGESKEISKMRAKKFLKGVEKLKKLLGDMLPA